MKSISKLAPLALLTLIAGNAKAETNMLESYPLVCQKALVLIDRGVKSFDKEYGPPLSKKSRKLTAPEFKGMHVIELTYRDAVSLIYTTANGAASIYEITLASAEAIKKARYDVETKIDIKKLFGEPFEETSSSLKYGCDNTEIIFKTKNERIISVNIIESFL